MNKNNSGFSLVELLICITLLVILFGGAFALMLSGTKINTSVTTSLDIQLDAKTTLESVTGRLIDCDGVCFEDTSDLIISRRLTIIEKDASGDPSMLAFDYNALEREITLTLYDGLTDVIVESGLLMRDVTAFEVSFTPAGEVTADAARVTLTLNREDRQRTEERVIALRNSPLRFANEAGLIDAFD